MGSIITVSAHGYSTPQYVFNMRKLNRRGMTLHNMDDIWEHIMLATKDISGIRAIAVTCSRMLRRYMILLERHPDISDSLDTWSDGEFARLISLSAPCGKHTLVAHCNIGRVYISVHHPRVDTTVVFARNNNVYWGYVRDGDRSYDVSSGDSLEHVDGILDMLIPRGTREWANSYNFIDDCIASLTRTAWLYSLPPAENMVNRAPFPAPEVDLDAIAECIHANDPHAYSVFSGLFAYILPPLYPAEPRSWSDISYNHVIQW